MASGTSAWRRRQRPAALVASPRAAERRIGARRGHSSQPSGTEGGELRGGGRGRDGQRPTGTEDPASGDAAGAAARSFGTAEVRPHSATAQCAAPR